MQEFFLKHKKRIIGAGIAILVLVTVIASGIKLNATLLESAIGVVVTPFQDLTTGISSWIDDTVTSARNKTKLKDENQELKQQIAEMEATVRQGEADSQENVFLRDLLDLRKQRRDLSDFETATVMERSVTNWTSSLTLDKGSVHGVEEGDCVIDGQGNLVGRISEVGYNWSTVLTVVDTDTSLGARVYRTQDIGIANGDFALMERGQLRLDSLPVSSQLLEGDLIVTSGLGGYLPPDLVIGSVSELRADDSDTSNYAILTPAADLNGLTEVCIIKSFEIVS